MRKLVLATAIAATIASPVAAQPSIAILTGSTSGVYYPLGNAISAIFLKTIPGARSTVQVTQGSVENLKLLEDGDGELAFSLGDSLSAAWKGNADAGFRNPLSKLRGVALWRMCAVSLISTIKVLRPAAMSSTAPTRVKMRSTRPMVAAAAGTKLPIWARMVIRATWRR